ncbi:MAG: polyprenyl synthetase family protein [Betaproteobacteria bacterium]|nr:polyprenyl synthetase family protein [Betaproteobacteria bacterium]NBO95208.1 polyprenyl synthetase family protein [Betaproteobacteria bacterium]NBP35297.1 polyprenyl synthetase family protein [Betaproteobacteria bacterium]NBP39653.1 polyprenyl synthetase family protein [Betaproteobacteria bacterium]NBQ77810.1 polyprenyl synthetase family protein [Betaproteobacteria bacterium]
MDTVRRIEWVLAEALGEVDDPAAPSSLAAALKHAVFPGGARIRPRLCLAVAMACGDDCAPLSNATAAAIELMHCASLVHDDLPCFDNADTRRGQPSVHKAFGERLAVLAGDALIVLAYQTLSAQIHHRPERAKVLLRGLSQAVGMPGGIVAGQAWESESVVDLRQYQRAKTGALFAAACSLGAASSGEAPSAWEALGNWLGEAYQVADDIRDVAADAAELGKPVGQDLCHGRPSAVSTLGLSGALERFNHLMGQALASIPECRGAKALRALLRAESQRLIPSHMLAHPHSSIPSRASREAFSSTL